MYFLLEISNNTMKSSKWVNDYLVLDKRIHFKVVPDKRWHMIVFDFYFVLFFFWFFNAEKGFKNNMIRVKKSKSLNRIFMSSQISPTLIWPRHWPVKSIMLYQPQIWSKPLVKGDKSTDTKPNTRSLDLSGEGSRCIGLSLRIVNSTIQANKI